MYRYKHNSSSSLSTFLLITLLTISTAQQNASLPQDEFSPDKLLDPCKETEFIDCSKCSCQELPSQFSAWMLAIAGFSSALSFLFLIFAVLIQQIRQKPGDLALGTIIGQIIFSVTIMIEKIGFSKPHDELVQQTEADGACIAFGLIKTFSAAMLNFYLFAFFAVYILSQKNYIKTSKVKSRCIHIAGVLITGIFGAVLLTWKAIGLNADGTCGMTSGPAILAPTVGYGVLTVFGAYLIYMTRKNLAAGREGLNEGQADFVKHYLFYLGIMCVLFLGGAVVAIASDIKTTRDDAIDNTMIHIFGFIQFTILNLSTIVLMTARLRDPLISVHIKDYLREKLSCDTPEADVRKRSYDEEEMCLGSVNDDVKVDIHKGFISNSSLIQAPYGAFQHSDSFEQYKKTEMLSSVLASLSYFWKESFQSSLAKTLNMRKERSPKASFGKKKCTPKVFSVRNSTLMSKVPQVMREFDRRNKKLLYGTFTAYLPDLLQELIDKEDLMLEIKDAWNFIPNYGNILSYGYQVDEYGKMFFLSSNGKYMLQEISPQEKKTLLQVLPGYTNHIKAYPDSLLARIYGMFTFEAEDHISQVHMIVMKNIGEWGWPGIEKLYKLRGPHTNNERKKGEYSPFNENDFEAYEGKLKLEMPLKANILNILNKDVLFLEENNFENYALQVSLVNKEKVSKEMVSSSVIIEVEEHGDISPVPKLVKKDRELLVRDYQEEDDDEDLTEETEKRENNIKTYVGVVDFWKEAAGKRSSLVWKTLRSLRPLKQETANDASARYGKAFLKYVESIVE